jgi:hypothetical protein
MRKLLRLLPISRSGANHAADIFSGMSLREFIGTLAFAGAFLIVMPHLILLLAVRDAWA